jgi:hypothetical protein
MKRFLFFMMFLAFMSACTPPQQVLNSWVDREAIPSEPYKSIFVMAFAHDINAKITVENELAKVLVSRGKIAVKSSDVFNAAFLADTNLTREQLANAIRQTGCDAALTIVLLDVKTEESYQPGTAYYPVEHTFYDSYNRYAIYYYGYVEEPGYTITDRTFYLEGNFYDLASDKLVWSIKSDSYNPSDLESWFHDYAYVLIKQLKKEGVIKK